MTKVDGGNKNHKVKMFTLSTCGWCKKTKRLMEDLDYQYEYFDIDLITGDEAKEVDKEHVKYNARRNVPTVVIDDGKEVIIGFKEEKIREALKDG